MNLPTVIAKTEEFHVEALLEFAAKKLILRPIGILNERVSLDVVFDYISNLGSEIREVVLELDGVSALNSSGLRAWLIFVEKIEAQRPVRFEKICEILFEQAGLVPHLLGKSPQSTVSFYAPYSCTQCGSRVLKLLSPEDVKLKTGGFMAPKFTCETCQTPLEFDRHLDEYFWFLK